MESSNAPEKKQHSLPDSNADSSEEVASPPELSSEELSSGEGVVPTEIVEALKELPPNKRQMVSSMFLSMERLSSSGSSALVKRVTPEHITQTLENLEKENERDFKKSQSSEVTKRMGMVATLVLVLMVLGYAGLTKDKDLAEKVIIAGISGIGGFGAGVAISKKE